MRRFVMKGCVLAGLAMVLPACGSSRSDSAGPAPTTLPADRGIESFADEGSMHVPLGSVVVYLTDPPTSGNHYPFAVAGGYYEFSIEAPYLVHSMEHGGVIIYYHPSVVTDAEKDSLKALAAAHPGVFGQVVCVPRIDPAYPFILTAWTQRLRLAAYDQARVDGFLTLFRDQGPERAPTDH